MTTSPLDPRAALVARSRKHFAAIAATGIVMTGALTACVSDEDTSTESTSDTGSSGSTSSTGTSAPGDPGGRTDTGTWSSPGVTSSDSDPDRPAAPDGSSNAS